MNVFVRKAIWVGLVLLGACSKPSDTPSRGEITITADESLQPVVDMLTSAYEGVNPNTNFNTVYKPEQEAISMMLRDSARLVFSTRQLNEREVAALNQEKIKVQTQFIATDGIALIVSQTHKDSLVTMAELGDIFKGKITRWEQLQGASLTGPIILVFDNNNSSNLTYMLKRFNVTDVSKLKIFTVNSNKQVIDYVRKNPVALGFIGVNWISDGDVPLTAELSKDLRVLGVSEKPNPTSVEEYYQPFQRNLGLELYPLRRKIYILSREAHSGLGGGLMTYIARDVGGLLIEKSGIWPAEPYNREVYLEKR
ncbi:phosphate transport system substrate-binding protein [Larkinella arboricola]|uniref:Phosphate transport system substrate-binding protein n=1 Tax=Larkinella arboricola TaxID=643671 RepID=A0A327X0B4_LARAB|nr:substrate-binding domain-containing protein [Larkinella arboricola]RAJ97724.1 phosphate transport system substrate-binding protein [Larkinella arboricola]